MKRKTTTVDQSKARLSHIVSIDEGRIRGHLGEMVRGIVEDTLNVFRSVTRDVTVQPRRGATPFVRFGFIIAWTGRADLFMAATSPTHDGIRS